VTFLHGFKHGGLGFGGRSVDLVSEDDVGKDGAFDKFKLTFSGLTVFLNNVSSLKYRPA
jgi:hypothetical protein